MKAITGFLNRKGSTNLLIESYNSESFLWMEKGQLILLIESYNSICE